MGDALCQPMEDGTSSTIGNTATNGRRSKLTQLSEFVVTVNGRLQCYQ